MRPALGLNFGICYQILLQLFCERALAGTVYHDFNITWVRAGPSGFERPMIGINGQWPVPVIHVDLGDRLVIKVNNQLGNQSTSLHYHGLFMNSTSYMDGAAGTSQCEIVPGASLTYDFMVQQPGTYWYHSHVKTQYPDGLRGALVVNDPQSPYRNSYDEEIVLTISDWYNVEMAILLEQFDVSGQGMHEPIPDANLLNDTIDAQVMVRPDTTYLIRLVNVGAIVGQYFWIENHEMTIVEVDGVYTQQKDRGMIYLGAGQRCSFLVKTKTDMSKNYPIVASLDAASFMGRRQFAQQNVTGWLVYNPEQPLPAAGDIVEYESISDMDLKPYDLEPLLKDPSKTINLNLTMRTLADGMHHWLLNGAEYKLPTIPAFYQALSSGSAAINPSTYGNLTNAFVLDHNEVVEVVIYNGMSGRHPLHLHGRNFQIVSQSVARAGYVTEDEVADTNLPRTPIRRDTVVVESGGHVVLRYRADNPGAWIFHCHMEWHSHSGLVATMIEAPLKLQEQLSLSSLPSDHLAACAAAGVSVVDEHEVANGKTGDITEDVASSEPEIDQTEDKSEQQTSMLSNAQRFLRQNMYYTGLAILFLFFTIFAAIAGYRYWPRITRTVSQSTKYMPLEDLAQQEGVQPVARERNQA